MTWYAVAAVDDAVGATREFLFPFSLVRWAKLAVLVLFMGGGMSYDFQLPIAPGEMSDQPSDEELPNGVGSAVDPGDIPISSDALIAIAALIAVVAVVAMLLSLVLRFVFYDALRTNDVRLLEPFKDRFGQAVRLFLFQLGLLLLVAGPTAAAGYVAFQRNLSVDAVGVAGALLLGLVGSAVFLLFVLVLRFTLEFVLPVMVVTDAGPIEAWREFWPTLRDEWTQYLAYLVVHFFLALGISVAEGVVAFVFAGIVVALGAMVGLIVVGLIGGFEAAIASVVGIAVLLGIAVVVVVVLLIVLLPIRVVVSTYLICYELCVLGGTNHEFVLLPPSVRDDLDVLDDYDGSDGGDSGGSGLGNDGSGGNTDSVDGSERSPR